MKHFYAILAGVSLLALAAPTVEARKADVRKHKIETISQKKGASVKIAERMVKKAPSTTALPEGVITELPDGVEGKLYVKQGIASYYDEFWDEVGLTTTDGFLCEIGYDGDKIYMSNPFSFGSYEKSYVEGTVKDGVATFTMPQHVANYYYDEDQSDYDCEYALVASLTQDYELSLEPSQTISFKIEEDGSLTNTKPGTGLFDLYVNDGWEWTGNGDILAALKPFNDKPVAAPEGIEFEQWNFFGLGDPYEAHYSLFVAFDGNDIYIKGLCASLPDGLVKGTIEGATVSFTPNQFMGINEKNNSCVYFAGTEYDNTDEVLTDPLTADFDAEKGYIDFGEGIVNFLTAPYEDGEEANYLDYFEEVRIVRPTSEAPTQIEAPEIAYVEKADDKYYGSVGFSIPIVYDEVNLVDTKKLYYRVYFDGELQTLEPGIYEIEEPMTEIPYDYANGLDIDISASSGLRWFTAVDDNVVEVGIQSVYIDGSITLESEISTAIVSEKSGIADIVPSTEHKADYFDLTGRKIEHPVEGGFYIRRIGNKVSKIIR